MAFSAATKSPAGLHRRGFFSLVASYFASFLALVSAITVSATWLGHGR